MSAVLRHADLQSRPMRLIAGWRCLRCNTAYEAHLSPIKCASCQAQGISVSLRADYSAAPSMGVMQAYDQPFSLGEGDTPCTLAPALAKAVDVAHLWIKDESRNPTGSHKDRMSAIGITQALETGAHTVVLASSGNAAISAARYAQAAGLRCEVAAYDGLPRSYAKLLDEYGAICHSFTDNEGRWAFVRERAQQAGYLALTNYSLPALGSAPLAIEGYKLIAQECADDGIVPTDVVVPTARGDLAWGIYAGFSELLHAGRIAFLPRIWIIEPFARLSRVLAGADLHAAYLGQTAQFSTAGGTVTYLQYQAATASLGGALVVGDDAARITRDMLMSCGVSAELCAAAALAAVATLRSQERISANSQVLWLLTADASRDPSFST